MIKKGAILFFSLLFIIITVRAQEDVEPLSIRGTVKSSKTKRPIAFANVVLKNSPIGINANEEGAFELNIEPVYAIDTLVFSAVGYVSQEYSVKNYLKNNNKTIYLIDTTYELSNIFITSIPAKEIVSRALRNIPKNYPTRPYMLKGFYRTSFKENNKYVRLLESALRVFDEGFDTENGISVENLKMRKSYDYRNYKWRENANYLASFVMGDFVRNPKGSMRDMFGRWDFNVRGITYKNKDEVFVVDAVLPVQNGYEKYNAKIYIRIKDYAILQLDYDYDWSPEYFPGVDVDSVTFKRTGVSVKTFYRQYRGKLYLSYQYRAARWNIYDKRYNNLLASKMEINDEILIHKIDPRHRRQPDEKLTNIGDIYKKVSRYDRRFWRRYNKPVDTELFRSVKRDLEKEVSLERQFRAEKMEDVMN